MHYKRVGTEFFLHISTLDQRHRAFRNNLIMRRSGPITKSKIITPAFRLTFNEALRCRFELIRLLNIQNQRWTPPRLLLYKLRGQERACPQQKAIMLPRPIQSPGNDKTAKLCSSLLQMRTQTRTTDDSPFFNTLHNNSSCQSGVHLSITFFVDINEYILHIIVEWRQLIIL